MVCGTMSNPGSASSTWTAEIVGHVIRSQSIFSDVKTACERKSCRRALVKFDELVMLMAIENTRTKVSLRVRLMPIQSCSILWIDLTKSCQRLTEL